MHPTRLLVPVTVGLLIGCGPAGADHDEGGASGAGFPVGVALGRHVASEVDVAELAEPDRGKQGRMEPAAPVGDPYTQPGNDPASAAAAAVIELLEAEDLYVLDLETEVATVAGDEAMVTVAVLHGTGRVYPHESRYQLTLTATGDRGWQVTALEAIP